MPSYGERVQRLEDLIGGADGVLVRQGIQEHQVRGIATDVAEVRHMVERLVEHSEGSTPAPSVPSGLTLTIPLAPRSGRDLLSLLAAIMTLLGLPVGSMLMLGSDIQARIERQMSEQAEMVERVIPPALERAVHEELTGSPPVSPLDPTPPRKP